MDAACFSETSASIHAATTQKTANFTILDIFAKCVFSVSGLFCGLPFVMKSVRIRRAAEKSTVHYVMPRHIDTPDLGSES